MKLKEPKNKNYCATVVEISILKPLENADRVQGAIIFGNQVVVSLDTKVGDIGLYFPVETQLSHEYCHANNLYRHKHLNADETKGGYFEDNRRVKCAQFRGNKSEGIFMPINSLKFIYPTVRTANLAGVDASDMLDIDTEFDELEGIPICNKYVPKNIRTQGTPGSKKDKKKAKGYESKLVDNQFRFHQDTSMLYKNLHRVKPHDVISITYKLHGTSGISSKILCKRKLNWREKFLKWLNVSIADTQYDYVYSSRKVIKNEKLNPNAVHFYSEDIWGAAHKQIEEFLEDGMTLYYEIVGYLPSGGIIQKDYDYGYPMGNKTFGIYIYRITYTNSSGKVFEFSAKQVQDWCAFRGLNAVPQLFYGEPHMLIGDLPFYNTGGDDPEYAWGQAFLQYIKDKYNDKDCYMCANKVPEEGCVIRIEKNDFEAYKQKSFLFYERESKDLDKGIVDIETDN